MNGSTKKVFLSYGRADASELADRLADDLGHHAVQGRQRYEPWRDRVELKPGAAWTDQIVAALRGADAVVAVLTPHAVRTRGDGTATDDSVCLDELAYARFAAQRPIVPVMGIQCTPPFEIFRLEWVDFTGWRDALSYQVAFAKLLDGIEAALRGERRIRALHERLLPWDFGPFLEKKRRGFVGRDWLFAEIDAWLRAPTQPAVLVVGAPGIGKSAIVAEYLHRNPGARILAYHCCQSTVDETLDPSRFVRSIAAMIASRHPQYERLVTDPGSPYGEVLAEARVREDPGSAFAEAIVAGLAAAGPPGGSGPSQPGERFVLVVDALDEAIRVPPKATTSIVRMLASHVDEFPDWVRIVATTRPECPVLDALAALRPFVLRADDPRNLDDIAQYAASRLGGPALAAVLAEAKVAPASAAEDLTVAASGNFLYAEQALNALENRRLAPKELRSLPPGLGALYGAFFLRQFPANADWERVEPFLAALVAGQDDLGVEEFSAASGLDEVSVLARVRELSSYLRETSGDPVRWAPYHRSLVEWLTRKAGGQRSIWPARGHCLLADGLFARYEADRLGLGPYTRSHLARHLAEAATASGGAARVDLLRRLATFVVDPLVQGQRLDDPFGVDASFRLALDAAASGPALDTAALALRIALGWNAFLRERLDARRLADLAREGNLDAFERELQLYGADDLWLQTARLVGAWLARDRSPAEADALRRRVRSDLPMLDERVDAEFENRAPVWKIPLPPASEWQATQILAGTGVEGLQPTRVQAAPPKSGERLDPEGAQYVAEAEAPVLVSFAHADPARGTKLLLDYISVHASNAYRVYRNGSLRCILHAVARHPDAGRTRDLAVTVTTAALAGRGREFGGATRHTLAVLRAVADPVRRAALEAQAIEAAQALAPEPGRNDAWGEHLRTFCALAEARHLVCGDDVRPLLERARSIPPGFAGFQAPASLTFTETLALCGQDPPGAAVLEKARAFSHNIQDAVFCAHTTSRVNALQREWWPRAAQDDLRIAGLVNRFARDPRAPDFAAVHVAGESYPLRRGGGAPLPAWLVCANTLEALAQAYQWPLAAFSKANPSLQPGQHLDQGSLVRVPDIRWAPMLAAYLASRVLRAPGLGRPERAALLLRLVPVAAPDGTALDTVLARLLVALGPQPEEALSALDESVAEFGPPEVQGGVAGEPKV